MSQNGSSSLGAADDSVWLEQRVGDFETAWQRGERPDLEGFLTTAGERRRPLLIELVHADLELRLKAGEPARVETYLGRYPELAEDPVVVVDLVRWEFAQRRRLEPGLSPGEFHRRFPHLRDQLRLRSGPSSGAPTQAASAEHAASLPTAPAGGGEVPNAPRIPGYEILGELGRGGMGVVYQARQTALGRVVALKMIRDEALAGAEGVARFEREAQAVARLQHPNIVQIFEVGRHEGRSFFSLEFVPGGSLADRLARAPLPPAEAARLVEQVARAMDEAHRAGIVHRDLKPANILLAVGPPYLTNVPGAEGTLVRYGGPTFGTPKITDFGLAKQLEDASGPTQSGDIMGTPSYMAPEQARGRVKEIGPHTDVYSLGAILYECLTGRPPFRGASVLETLEQVCAQEPVPPRQLQPKCPRDLETICLKCLQKEPTRRYPDAVELADDLRRFTAGEPVRARPTPAWERAWKWARRRPVPAALGAVSLLALLVILVGGTWFLLALRDEKEQTKQQWLRAEDEKQLAETHQHRAEENEREARWQAYLAEINLAQRAYQEADVAHALDLLRGHQPRAGQADLRGFEWFYLWRLCHADLLTLPLAQHVTAVAFSPDGRTLAAGYQDGTIRLLDTVTGKERPGPPRHPRSVGFLAFAADGQRLLSAGRGLEGGLSTLTELRVWDGTEQPPRAVPGFPRPSFALAISPDGKRFALAPRPPPSPTPSELTVQVCEMDTGRPVLTLRGHKHTPGRLAFSPDGEHLVSASARELLLWDLTKEGQPQVLGDPGQAVSDLAFSPDGRRLARVGRTANAESVWVRDLKTGGDVLSLPNAGSHVVFSRDGKRLATLRPNKSATVWDAMTGRELFTIRGHGDWFWDLAFGDAGRRLVLAGPSRATVWDATSGPEATVLPVPGQSTDLLVFSPDSRLLATASGGGGVFEIEGAVHEVAFWETAGGRKVRIVPGLPRTFLAAGLSPDLRRLALVREAPTRLLDDPQRCPMAIHDTATGQESLALHSHAGRVAHPTFSPDGRFLVAAIGLPGRPGYAKLWDATDGRELSLFRGHSDFISNLAFSPDGKLLATASQDRTVRLWDTATGEELLRVTAPNYLPNGVAFRPDGQAFAAACNDGAVRVWEVSGGRELALLRGHTNLVADVVWSPDGRRLASGSWDQTVKIWDPAAGKELLTLRGHTGQVNVLAFSPDGRHLASAGGDRAVRIWDASPVPE
jgi:WD40 repeat protein/serine/threonine protein kinase